MNHISQMEPWGRHSDGRHPGMFLFCLIVIAGLVTLGVLLYRSRRPAAVTPVVPNPSANAEAILAERLARGEVSVQDFNAARAALRGDSVPAEPPSDS